MAPLSEEEENYIRLALLLKGVSPRAVRTFFDNEFPPTYLPSTLNKNYNTLNGLFKKRILNQAQWNLLFPKNAVPDSKTFDVTLMICLIRNLTPINSPFNGFDKLPLPGETTPGSDLARIKWYRNILAHHDSNTMSTSDFNTAWTNIADAVSRLGGLPMKQESQDLKVKILDQSNQEIMLEIKQSQEKIKELRRAMDMKHSIMTDNLKDVQDSNSILQTEHLRVTETLRDLQNSHRTLQTEHLTTTKNLFDLKNSHSSLQIEHSKIIKDPIPWNIRGQITEELENWKEDDKTFIETNGAKHVLKCINENGCVVVTAGSGCGKTSLVRHVALQMRNKGYEILPISNPKEIIKWFNPIKKILFVVDDLCGTYTLNQTKFDIWISLMEKIKALVENKPVKLIMSCRLQVYRDDQMKSLSLVRSCECNLLSADLCLSKTEKQSIADLYLQSNASKISELHDVFDCFPLLCRLYSKNHNLNIVDFFTNPFTVYSEEIDKLQRGAHVKYCALALCVMFNNQLKEEWLTEDVNENIKKVIKNTYEACKVLEGTSRLALRDELDSLTYTFIRKDGNVYRTIHDKLFDFLAFYFGNKMIYCLINYASSRFICERLLFEGTVKGGEFAIVVPEKYQQLYLWRMVDDWSRKNVGYVLNNINRDNKLFMRRLLLHIKDLDISQQKQLAHSYDKTDKSSPLILSCFIGDIDLVKWCLNHCISNVNYCCEYGRISPLHMACRGGYTDVVRMLIKNEADINKCKDTEESPLFIACEGGHTEVVKMLINNKADINKCTDKEISPLCIACHQGNTEVVQMLIDNKANINKCTDKEASPLSIACQQGNTEVVQILIKHNADINKCNNNGASPLYIACQEGHSEVVQILINNKADITKCKDDEISVLLIASQQGHVEVVKILLRNKADINKSSNRLVSPLSVACERGHTEIVDMLISNKADVNYSTKEGESPIFIACQNGHNEVVNTLINNKADINKCRNTGESPLCIACEGGHTKVVQMLINDKADINKCNENEASPLLYSCKMGHTKIVEMLLDNNADIHKRNDKEVSALFAACEGGHTDVVQMLMNNHADINQCNDKERSPMYIACQEGHTKVVHILINNKADINKCGYFGVSPLCIACQKGHTEVVQMLINVNADIDKCTDFGVSPLYIACQEGHIEIVHILIDNKADIDKCKTEEISPLFIACLQGHIEIVQFLLNNKATINKCNDKEVSPMFAACHQGHTEVVQMLINNKADINKCDEKEVSPLFAACHRGHTEVVQMLINNKADINKCNDKEVSPLFTACQQGNTEVVQILIKHNADINKCNNNGASPLYIACQEGHSKVVNNKEASPLFTACHQGHTEVVHMLINNKADINKGIDNKVSPLIIACRQKHTEVVQMLLQNKANINEELLQAYTNGQEGRTRTYISGFSQNCCVL